ncbi:MAG TPA: DUF4232 domain-containing protein [Acidimicrobiales bacterium]|nr:DUF4232 domain-containing protein [Acidimicrobiales bacterium]
MTLRPRLLALLFAVGPLVLLLAACGSSATTSTTTTLPTVTTTTSTPSGSTTPSVPECATSALVAQGTFSGTAAGRSYSTVSVKNTGSVRCALDGYPTYKFLGPSGAGGVGAGSPVAISTRDSGPAPSQVILAPGSTADSILVYSDIPSGGSSCPSVASALLTPPGSTESVAFPISLTPCGGSVLVYPFGAAGSESP